MKPRFLIPVVILIALHMFAINPIYGQEQTASDVKRGKIKGNVIDRATKSPLPGVGVMIAGTQTGASTDLEGNFSIRKVPVGNYTLRFQLIGYKPLSKTDVVGK